MLDLLVSGITRKLAEVSGHVEAHEMLSLIILYDHDVIDGAPAARSTHKLAELIESGTGLEELQSNLAKDCKYEAVLEV